MTGTNNNFASVDAYVASFPDDVRARLEAIRQTVHKAVPGTVETISYQIPTFKIEGRALIYVAAWQTHIAVYPIPEGTEAFRRVIAPYIAGKGTVRFPMNKPVPYDLIRQIVLLRLKEGEA